MLFYYIILRPFKILEPDIEFDRYYRELGLIPRFKYFKTWRQYEYMHIFCWCCKDFCWAIDNRYLWPIFVTPTVLIAIDFIYHSWKAKRMVIDCVHYIALLLWVCANCIWAGSELYGTVSDDPYYLFDFSHNSMLTPRWYSSWVLFIAFMFLFAFHCVWMSQTYYNNNIQKFDDLKVKVTSSMDVSYDISMKLANI